MQQKDGTKISKKWKIVGYMGLVGSFGILAYYMVLGGWVMTYISNIITGNFDLSSKITEAAKGYYLQIINKQLT